MTPCGTPSIRLSTMRMPDAPSRSERLAGAVAANHPQHVPLAALQPLRKLSRQIRRDRGAVAARLRRERTTTSGNAALEPCDLCVRHGIQRADLQKNTGFRWLTAAVSAAGGACLNRLFAPDQTSETASANPPDPTAITEGPAAEIDSAIVIRSASVAASNIRVVDGVREQLGHVAGFDRRHRVAAECRALHRLAVHEQAADSTVRPITGYAGHTKARASG